MILRGRRIERTNSSGVPAELIFLFGPTCAIAFSTKAGSRSHTTTAKPWLSMFIARFEPITPTPAIPISASAIGYSPNDLILTHRVQAQAVFLSPPPRLYLNENGLRG